MTKIRYNPQTREVEIEGSEEFVEKHFKQIQGLFATLKETADEPARAKGKAGRVPSKQKPATGRIRGKIFTAVIDAIKASSHGMSTPDLMKVTDYSQQQVRSVIFKAAKTGIIRTARRGVYVAV